MGKRNNDFDYKDGVSLKDYFESKIRAIEKASAIRARALDKRLESMNEFRASLKDQSSKFITRDEINICLNKIDEDIDDLEKYRASLEGKANTSSVYIAYLIAFIGIVISVIGIIK